MIFSHFYAFITFNASLGKVKVSVSDTRWFDNQNMRKANTLEQNYGDTVNYSYICFLAFL